MGAKAKKVFVGMSGGVDSSVAAYLLKKGGYDVVGVFLRCYNLDGCAERDAEDARRVTGQLDIPFYVWDMEEEYKNRVVKYMIDGYRSGITPNPDVMCNREIKFGLFAERALALGADYVATGHYARLESGNGTFKLYEAEDKGKDQSYFLWKLTQRDLAHALFPVGKYRKDEIRRIAREVGLATAEKKDSQGICFLGKVTLQEFLKAYIPERKGVILDVSGKRLGEHPGAEFFTIGQRHTGISSTGNPSASPRYVVSKDVTANTVTVAEGSENENLFKKEVELKDLNFIGGWDFPLRSMDVLSRVRYRQPLFGAKLSIQGAKQILVFSEPQKFIAPGQSAVFYSKEGELLGGGTISG